MTVIDKRGKGYELEINDDGTVNIFLEEGQNCNVDVSGNALWMLKNGDGEYPLDVDEWDEWINEVWLIHLDS